MNKAFPIAPTGPLPGALIFGFLGIVYVSVLGAYIYDQNAARWGLWLATCIVGAVSVFIGAFVFHNRSQALFLAKDELILKAPFYGRTVPLDAINQDNIQELDLTSNSTAPYRLAVRRNGVGLPRLQLGWFRLKNDEKAWCYITDPKSVLYIPSTEGYVILVSAVSPDAVRFALTEQLTQ